MHHILKSLAAKLAESAIESHIGLRANLCGKMPFGNEAISTRQKGLKGYRPGPGRLGAQMINGSHVIRWHLSLGVLSYLM